MSDDRPANLNGVVRNLHLMDLEEDPRSLPLFADAPALTAESTSRLGQSMTSGPGAPYAAGKAAGAGSAVDWALVASLRKQASQQLTAKLQQHGDLDAGAREQLVWAIIGDLLQAEATENVTSGRQAWTPEEEKFLAQALFDAIEGLGRLQPLVDREDVENIIVQGCDNVWLETVDGDLEPGPPVAESDEELIGFLEDRASQGDSPRSFNEASPRLHMKLKGGARLAAAAWVMPRPSVVIRRHRLLEVTLAELVGRDMLSPLAASFLEAAVRARKNIVIAGPMGSGKTTMVRGLCACIPEWEPLGTFETEYELFLHELVRDGKRVHPIVHAWESRPGSGEVGIGGRVAGEFTLAEALTDSYRFYLSRQIVGEVRGSEIWTMIKAMESGTGSISTTHAADAEATIRKLVTCAMEAGSHVTRELATSKLAETVDIVVQLHLRIRPNGDGSFHRERWVAEIITVEPGEQLKGYATSHAFAPMRGRSAVAHDIPSFMDELVDHGFNASAFEVEAARHRGVIR